MQQILEFQEKKRKKTTSEKRSELMNSLLEKVTVVDTSTLELFGLEGELKDISTRKDIVVKKIDDKKEIMMVGFGNETCYLHVVNTQTRRAQAIYYIDFKSQKATEVTSLDDSVLFYGGRIDIAPKGQRPAPRDEWYADGDIVNLPSVQNVKNKDFFRVLTMMAPSHELWHASEHTHKLSEIKYPLRGLIEYWRNLFRSNFQGKRMPNGRPSERSAMLFTLRYLRICKEKGVDILRNPSEDENYNTELRKYMNLVLHY